MDVGKVKERISGLSSTLPQSLGQSLGKVLKRDKPTGSGPPKSTGGGDAVSMTREQALRVLGLRVDATEGEIDAALAKETKRQTGLNGSDHHAIAAKLDAAREILRGQGGA